MDLAIFRAIVEAHPGIIGVLSAPGGRFDLHHRIAYLARGKPHRLILQARFTGTFPIAPIQISAEDYSRGNTRNSFHSGALHLNLGQVDARMVQRTDKLDSLRFG
jgi:hypothetical protein